MGKLVGSSAARGELHVPNMTSAVAAALNRPSRCVPDGGVMLSLANPHHRALRAAQFERVRHLKCFMRRVVSLCYGNWTDGLGTCVRAPCTGRADGLDDDLDSACLKSDYRRGNYVSLNWAKWPIFIDALTVARTVLWLEADVAIVRNPWEGLLPLLAQPRMHDVLYQWELPPCGGVGNRALSSAVAPGAECCGAVARSRWHPEPLNCGQLVLTSLAFARAVWAPLSCRRPSHGAFEP